MALEEKITYSTCPLCDSPDVAPEREIKDFSVSGEVFPVWKCNDCTGLFTQNIPSQKNIGRYYESEQYISHTEASSGLMNSAYLKVRNITLRSKYAIVKKYCKKDAGNLLDFGAGTGAFVSHMRSRGWKAEGIEPSETARKNAVIHHKLVLLEPERLNGLEDASYDAITLWHVLEHVHHLKPSLEKLLAKLKPEGRIFIAVPNYTSYDAAVYGDFWAAYDVPRHLYHFSPYAFRKFSETVSLEVETILPMWFDSFYVSMLSEKYRSGKTKIIPSLLNGVLSNLKAIFIPGRSSSVVYVCKKKPKD